MKSLFCALAFSLIVASPLCGQVIHISTLPGIRFDISTFYVKPGANVTIVVTNSDEMTHNFVITAPGARSEVVNAAKDMGEEGLAKNFVPASSNILWAAQVVLPNKSTTLRFKAPKTKGDYPFVCTFPGHGESMYGTMVVTSSPKPPVPNTNAPSMLFMDHAAMGRTGKAQLIRAFMPNAGPASIAVALPDDYSYCWDAGAVRFRYAWKGGYVQEVYRLPKKIIGDIFYKEEPGFPLRAGATPDSVPDKIQFRGYGLEAGGIPEFEYEFSGISVRERIDVKDGKMIRHFHADAKGKTLWFAIPPDRESQLTSTGKKEGAWFKFAGKDATDFSITIAPSIPASIP